MRTLGHGLLAPSFPLPVILLCTAIRQTLSPKHSHWTVYGMGLAPSHSYYTHKVHIDKIEIGNTTATCNMYANVSTSDVQINTNIHVCTLWQYNSATGFSYSHSFLGT